MDPSLIVSLAVIASLTLLVTSTGYAYHLGRSHGHAEVEGKYVKAQYKELLLREERLLAAREDIGKAEITLGELPDLDVDSLLDLSSEEKPPQAPASDGPEAE